MASISLSFSSSIVPTPVSHAKSNPNPITLDPILRVTRCLSSSTSLMKLIVLLGKSGQPRRAHQLFSTIKEDGCESTQLYTALLAAYCRNSLIDEAFLALDEMKSLPHCQPDISTYSTLIKACVNALKFELVELLYEDVAERSIMLNTVTQNVVLSGYGKAGRFDQMEKLLSSMMESTTCKPLLHLLSCCSFFHLMWKKEISFGCTKLFFHDE